MHLVNAVPIEKLDQIIIIGFALAFVSLLALGFLYTFRELGRTKAAR